MDVMYLSLMYKILLIVMYCRRVVMHRTFSTRCFYVQENGGYVPYAVVQDMKNGYEEWKEFTRYYKVIHL